MDTTTNPNASGTTIATKVEQATYRRGLDFWMVYVSNLVVDMLSVLDTVSSNPLSPRPSPNVLPHRLKMAVSTALPTIVDHLRGTDFIWAGSAFTIASTAIVPFVGDLVSGFGRKPALLTFILVFAVGSAICGGAQNMNMLIAGRGDCYPLPFALDRGSNACR